MASTFITKTSVPDVTAFPVVSSLDELSRVATDYGSALSDYSCFAKPVITPVTLPEGATLLDVFRVVFDDGATLLQTYHAKRGDTEQKWGEWRPAAAGSPSCSGQRLFECLTIIKVVMAKVCQYTEYQRYAFMTVGGAPSLVVQLSGQALGVMFSDSFRAETLLVFTQGPKAVTMSAFGHVQFLRSVWVKKKILSTTLDTEMPECFTMLAQMIVEYLRSMSSPNGICPLSMEVTALDPPVAAAAVAVPSMPQAVSPTCSTTVTGPPAGPGIVGTVLLLTGAALSLYGAAAAFWGSGRVVAARSASRSGDSVVLPRSLVACVDVFRYVEVSVFLATFLAFATRLGGAAQPPRK